MGYLNADPNTGRVWKSLEDSEVFNKITLNNLQIPGDNFTYLSTSHNSSSWLDQVISPSNLPIIGEYISYDTHTFRPSIIFL